MDHILQLWNTPGLFRGVEKEIEKATERTTVILDTFATEYAQQAHNNCSRCQCWLRKTSVINEGLPYGQKYVNYLLSKALRHISWNLQYKKFSRVKTVIYYVR